MINFTLISLLYLGWIGLMVALAAAVMQILQLNRVKKARVPVRVEKWDQKNR